MKSTRIAATNQRIDRITMQHAIIGIDMAKDTHVAQMTDYRGRVITPRHFPFSNSLEGFQKFLHWAQEWQSKRGLSSLLVGFEPTGHYWFNLANWLLKQGIEVVLVNPVTVHRLKETRDNSPSKNDAKDALTIADVISRGNYTDYSPQAEVLERLKTLMSNREYWVKQSISLGNRIIRWIDLYFPEYSKVFPDWTITRSLATLRDIPLPSELRGLQADEIIEKWRKQGMKRAGGRSGKAKAVELLMAAKRSIGAAHGLEEARRDLRRLLDAYETAMKNMEEIQQELEALLDEIPVAEQLRSLKGLGPVYIAVILGCAGDLTQYAHGRQLLRRAGLNLAENTSGRFKGQIKLAKRGDSMLRKYLFLAVLSLIRQNPDFQRWHEHNVKGKGMKKVASVFKLIGKLARILVGMVQRGESYRPEFPIPTAA